MARFKGSVRLKLSFCFSALSQMCLCFLLDLLDVYKAFSTIKVYLAAIAACHVAFGGAHVGQNPLIKRFMKGAHRLRPMCKPFVPSKGLPTVLEALS